LPRNCIEEGMLFRYQGLGSTDKQGCAPRTEPGSFGSVIVITIQDSTSSRLLPGMQPSCIFCEHKSGIRVARPWAKPEIRLGDWLDPSGTSQGSRLRNHFQAPPEDSWSPKATPSRILVINTDDPWQQTRRLCSTRLPPCPVLSSWYNHCLTIPAIWPLGSRFKTHFVPIEKSICLEGAMAWCATSDVRKRGYQI
jgi:hypothetical protein